MPPPSLLLDADLSEEADHETDHEMPDLLRDSDLSEDDNEGPSLLLDADLSEGSDDNEGPDADLSEGGDDNEGQPQCQGQALVVAQPLQLAQQPPQPVARGNRIFATRMPCGRGRWGSKEERHGLAARMREGRALRRAQQEGAARKAAEQHVAETKGSSAKGGNTHRRKLGLDDLQRIAFSPVKRSADLAAIFEVDTKWIRSVLCFMASVAMQAQLLILGCLLARACLERPEFFGYRLAWDETGQQLTLFLNGGTTESCTWQVMVMRLHMVILWGASEWYEMTIVLPPIVIPSTSAANMCKGLFCHPMTTKVWTGIAYLLGRAIFSCILAESDAASANLKLGAFLTAVAKNHHSSHFLHWLCSLHQAQLSEISMVAAAGKSIKMVARLYSLTLLLKGASMMASMKLSLPTLMESSSGAMLHIHHGQAPADCAAFAHELCNYMLVHYMRSAASQEERRRHHWIDGSPAAADYHNDAGMGIDILTDPKDVKHTGLRSYLVSLQKLVQCLNGELWIAGKLISYCGHAACAGVRCGINRGERIRCIAQALKETVFRHKPTVPEVSKWTKLGPCLDSILLGMLVHRIFYVALSQVSVWHEDGKDDDAAAAEPNDDDQEYLTAVNFAKHRGIRHRVACAFLREPFHATAILILALCLEPHRFLSAWLMRRASDQDPCASPPMIVDLFNEAYSPVRHLLQYLATMSRGLCSRLILLWRSQGCGNFAEWCDAFPSQVRLLRRTLLVASVTTDRRQARRAHKARNGICLLSLIDPRQPLAKKRHRADWFVSHRPCCLKPGFAREAWHSLSDAVELLGPKWSNRLHGLARLLKGNCADVEWRHGRNRGRAQKQWQDTVTMLAARGLLSEASLGETVKVGAAITNTRKINFT